MAPQRSPKSDLGISKLSTSSVIAIANTPSLNASSRVRPSRAGSYRWRRKKSSVLFQAFFACPSS
jgi:hypothetical protein